MDVPEGYEHAEIGPATVVVRADVREVLLAAGIDDPIAVVARSPHTLRGRGALGRIDLGPLGWAVVRPLRRGGLLGKVVRRMSLDAARARAELSLSAAAEAFGVPVLQVLAAVTRRAGLGYHHALVTLEVDGARDLMAVLRESGPAERASALRAAGHSVRSLHNAGVDHVDLNLKNVLITPAGRALVIDLDGCRAVGRPAPYAVVENNLLRLYRSWVKLSMASPQAVRARDPLRFLRVYAAGDRQLKRCLLAAGKAASFAWRRALWRIKPPRVG